MSVARASGFGDVALFWKCCVPHSQYLFCLEDLPFFILKGPSNRFTLANQKTFLSRPSVLPSPFPVTTLLLWQYHPCLSICLPAHHFLLWMYTGDLLFLSSEVFLEDLTFVLNFFPSLSLTQFQFACQESNCSSCRTYNTAMQKGPCHINLTCDGSRSFNTSEMLFCAT